MFVPIENIAENFLTETSQTHCFVILPPGSSKQMEQKKRKKERKRKKFITISRLEPTSQRDLPTHGRDFSYDPHFPSGFSKNCPQTNTPAPLRKFQFFPTPPGNISISCLKQKIS